MIRFRPAPVTIDGHAIPRRRFTVWAWLYFLAFVAAPVLAVAALLDVLVYLTLIR